MDKLYELLKESALVQLILAIMFGATVCYMYLTGMEVPRDLVALLGAILGFYFGGKAIVEARRLGGE